MRVGKRPFGRSLVRAALRVLSIALVLLGFLAIVSLMDLDIPETSVEDDETIASLIDLDIQEAAVENGEPIVWLESYEESPPPTRLDKGRATNLPSVAIPIPTMLSQSDLEPPSGDLPENLPPSVPSLSPAQFQPNAATPAVPFDPLSLREDPPQAETSKTITLPHTAQHVQRLVIPAIELDAQVVDVDLANGEWDLSSVLYDVAHLKQPASREPNNNIVLAGHVTLWSGENGPFRWLHKLEVGGHVVVYDQNTPYTYTVRALKMVKPSDVSVVLPGAKPTLTLITCIRWNRELQKYTMRLVVIATPVDDEVVQ